MVRKRSAILCGHLGRQAQFRNMAGSDSSGLLENEGSHDLEL